MPMTEPINPPAYKNGWLAHKAGCSIEDNPYSRKTHPSIGSLWRAGFLARENALKNSDYASWAKFDHLWSWT